MGRGFCACWRRGDYEILNTCRPYYWRGRIAGISPNEPPHIHVDRDDRRQIALGGNLGFGPAELRGIHRLVGENCNLSLEKWYERFPF